MFKIIAILFSVGLALAGCAFLAVWRVNQNSDRNFAALKDEKLGNYFKIYGYPMYSFDKRSLHTVNKEFEVRFKEKLDKGGTIYLFPEKSIPMKFIVVHSLNGIDVNWRTRINQ